MSLRKIQTWRDPYDMGFSTTRPREIEIQSGVTVLVGCNGIGKTTLIENIKSELKKENIPTISYDNLNDGGSDSFSMYFHNNDLSTAASIFTASEGEKISINLSNVMGKVRNFLKNGKYVKNEKYENLVNAFRGDKKEKEITSNERWLLFDAIDSGYSIDNTIEMKRLFDLILKDSEAFGVETYIIVSANAFEFAYGNNCMDVTNGKYLTFKDYDEYKKFILKTREKKDKRYKNMNSE